SEKPRSPFALAGIVAYCWGVVRMNAFGSSPPQRRIRWTTVVRAGTRRRNPRQGQTRREAGTQSYGLLSVRGGTVKAARLPKGWTGPESKSGVRASARGPGLFLRAWSREAASGAVDHVHQLAQPAHVAPVEVELQPGHLRQLVALAGHRPRRRLEGPRHQDGGELLA